MKIRTSCFLGTYIQRKQEKNPNQGRVYNPEGIAPTLNCKGGGNLEPFILIKANTKAGYEVAELGDSVNLEYPNSTTRRGRVGKQVAQTITTSPNQGGGVVLKPMTDKVLNPLKGKTEYGWHFEQQVYDQEGVTRALKAGGGSGNIPKVIKPELTIRKLTPKECFRLMGFDDSDVDVLIENGISNTQLYKMAGNSIVVNVLEFLFCQMFDSNNEIWV